MSETALENNIIVEKQLSHVNAKLADAMVLLTQSTASIKLACSVISGLQNVVEDIYITLDGEANPYPSEVRESAVTQK